MISHRQYSVDRANHLRVDYRQLVVLVSQYQLVEGREELESQIQVISSGYIAVLLLEKPFKYLQKENQLFDDIVAFKVIVLDSNIVLR